MGSAASLQAFLDSRVHLRELLKEQLSLICKGINTITLEVGCGHGHFLVAYGQAYSNECCIGFDVLNGRIRRAKAKVDKRALENIHFLKADAELFFEALPRWVRIDKTFILFPDPWPKARHLKHRLMQDKYLNAIAQKSTQDAKLYFRTDHREYFEASKEVIDNNPYWWRSSCAWLFEHETVFQTMMGGSYYSLVAQVRP